MHEATLIFPHQLFRNHPSLEKNRPVYLVEEWLFFRQYTFHCQKLVLHRASMKYYEHWLQQQGYTVYYVETTSEESDCRKLLPALYKKGIRKIFLADVADNWLLKRLTNGSVSTGIALHIHDSPGFLNTRSDIAIYFGNKEHFFQTDFYIRQRKERALLLCPKGKPLGGKWSFDQENRLRFPKNNTPPSLPVIPDNLFLCEARVYVQTHFPANYGSVNTPHLFCVTHADSERWLDDFIQHRLAHFGHYEDALVASEAVLHHSVLTPMLNIGLLTPRYVLNRVLEQASALSIPINSLEGFTRQLVGWREFIRGVYETAGSRQRTTNYLGATRRIPASFYTGTTGIAPVDITIKKVLQNGYCHHIERLMVLGNFMLLCAFDPNEVYRWFMELFTDAYDWVMVPNVYGMTQFADGGLMTTKPYTSGSNYLMKMGDYPKGSWQAVWDGLFWRFMHQHRHWLSNNPRLGMLIGTFDKMPEEKRNGHLQQAEHFLHQLNPA